MFFSSILWCSQSGNHLDENLAKFGYNPNMKISLRKEIFLYSILGCGDNLQKNLAKFDYKPNMKTHYEFDNDPIKIMCFEHKRRRLTVKLRC